KLDLLPPGEQAADLGGDQRFHQPARPIVPIVTETVGSKEGATSAFARKPPAFALQALDGAPEVQFPPELGGFVAQVARRLLAVLRPAGERLHGAVDILRDREGAHVFLKGGIARDADLEFASHRFRPEEPAVRDPDSRDERQPEEIRLVAPLYEVPVEDAEIAEPRLRRA